VNDERRKRGPDPERLKLPHEDWEEAVKEVVTVRTVEYEGGEWSARMIPPTVWPHPGDPPDLSEYMMGTLVFSGPDGQTVRGPVPDGLPLRSWTDDMLRERLSAFLSR